MAIISYNLLEDFPKINNDFVLTIGNFDGLHLGHQTILKKTFDIAYEKGYKKVLITFSNKPAALFEENFLNTQIFPITSKIEYFEILKIDYIFIFEFNSNLKNLGADQFLKFLSSNSHLKEVVIGQNFTFGKGKSGNSALLKKYFENYNVLVTIIPLLYKNGQLISSTMIRQHIISGDFSINKYLFEPFYIKGLVESGKHFGRLIDFPTANIYIYEQIIPRPAVYATITAYKKDNFNFYDYDFSMTFIGLKGEVETHIFDKNLNLYNKEIKVYFISFIRDNIKIESLAHLENLLKNDKENILKFFNSIKALEIGPKMFLKKISGSIFDV
jgi:riboflavin kinase/FMN adenylyltransferase